MLEFLIASQLFGISSETREIKNYLKYGTTGSSFQAWVFICWLFLSMLIWPVNMCMKAWRRSRILGVVCFFTAGLFCLVLFPFYAFVGFCWGVYTFASAAQRLDREAARR